MAPNSFKSLLELVDITKKTRSSQIPSEFDSISDLVKPKAHDIVTKILKDEVAQLEFVNFAQYERRHGYFRSEVYKEYNFLFYEVSTTCAV